MKGNSELFEPESDSSEASSIGPVNGDDYNIAGSDKVEKVEKVSTISCHSMPASYEPNTCARNFKESKLITERYFDEEGRPYLDIDYTNHGNPEKHPYVPHQHVITSDEEGIHRGKQEDI